MRQVRSQKQLIDSLFINTNTYSVKHACFINCFIFIRNKDDNIHKERSIKQQRPDRWTKLKLQMLSAHKRERKWKKESEGRIKNDRISRNLYVFLKKRNRKKSQISKKKHSHIFEQKLLKTTKWIKEVIIIIIKRVYESDHR